MRAILGLTWVIVTAAACTNPHVAADGSTAESASESKAKVVLTSEVEWGPLNPARGDRGPRAATLWGDRSGPGPSGSLVEFSDGFQSPPHLHNVSYRGVVISGLVHNDDPNADDMWLPTGSFWTQPKGAVHITAAKGSRNLAYIEIEEGPYLVLPVEEEFDSGEVPMNVDASNLVWLAQPGSAASDQGPKVAFLWGNPQGDSLNGTLVRLPTGFTGTVRGHGSTLHAVVVQGRAQHRVPGETDIETLEPGSHFSSTGVSVHHVACDAQAECTLYLRVAGEFDVVPTPH